MSDSDLSQPVVLVQPNVESMRKVAARLLQESRNAQDARSLDDIGIYLEELNEMVLNLMARGDLGKLRELVVSLRDALSTEAEDPDLLGSFVAHKQLVIRLEVLARQIGLFLRTDNVAKYLGLLAGNRRVNWGYILMELFNFGQGDGGPVHLRQIVQSAPLGMRNEAVVRALDEMVDIGLLIKEQRASSDIQFGLTWTGRRVAQTLIGLHADDDVKVGKMVAIMARGETMMDDVGTVGLPPITADDLLSISH